MFAHLIDHTILAADATPEIVRRFCTEARIHEFQAVCVNGGFVALVAEALRGSAVRCCAVAGFPLGAATPEAKAFEAAQAVAHGAREIDMVMAIGQMKAGNADFVKRDMAAVRDAAAGVVLKVIIEACLLSDEEKRLACLMAREAGADFVKTSTGFSTGGATIADVALMRETVGPAMGVKASGGIRTREAAEAMLAAGATRIGASASVALLGTHVVV